MRKAGTFFVILGTVLLCAALALFFYNRQEDATAQEAVVEVMPQLVEQIKEQTAAEEVEEAPELQLQIPVELLTEEDVQMTEMEVDGNGYIGYLSIPSIELELPIMSDWSYSKLRIAPCRYTGTIRGEDLVLVAHNYRSHFGKLNQLQLDDQVLFTDVLGNVTQFVVVGKDILPPTAVEEMTAGAYDLTLFTCTYGGSDRFTVYCDITTE